jgi:hypothetical protein
VRVHALAKQPAIARFIASHLSHSLWDKYPEVVGERHLAGGVAPGRLSLGKRFIYCGERVALCGEGGSRWPLAPVGWERDGVAVAHADELRADWELAVSEYPLNPIDPLR